MSNSIPGVDCLYHVPVERSEGLKLLITTQKSTTISPRSEIDLRGDVIISFFFLVENTHQECLKTDHSLWKHMVRKLKAFNY